jgi:Cu+-exporting ATPase
LSEVSYMVFDKTGTLTTGDFKIKKINLFAALSLQEVQNIVFSLEIQSAHPIAKSMCRELKEKATLLSLENVLEVKGQGISGNYSNKHYNIATGVENGSIDLFEDQQRVASIEIQDELKSDVKEVIMLLKKQGIQSVMLSGDRKEKCENIGKEIGIDLIYSEQKPADKLKVIDALSAKGKVAMLGDGINDAPALTKAHVGISFGGATDVAQNSAQVILLNNKSLKQLGEAISLCKITLTTIKQNLFWALFYNVLAIPIAAFGWLLPIFAAIAMAFSDIIVIGNSLRIKSKTLN